MGRATTRRKSLVAKRNKLETFEKEQDISTDGREPAAEVSFRTALLLGLVPSAVLRKMHGKERLDT
jgi:hypothetical protein